MVTAQHCGTNLNWQTPTVFGFPARAVGRSNAGNSNTDSMLITGGAYSAFMYRGDWASNTGRQITSIGSASINQKVCTSGGLSGEVCNATVDRINVIGPNGAWPGYFAKTSSSSVPLSGQGDSGAPGFAVASTTGNITILGIVISAYLTEKATDCTGGTSNPWNNSVPARECFFRVHFINAGAIEAALGVTGLTSP
jgi:streptogrisin D